LAPAVGLNPAPPVSPVKLIFIHHSCGKNWLTKGNGGLDIALKNNLRLGLGRRGETDGYRFLVGLVSWTFKWYLLA
jgi:hypothetical protein